MCNILLKTNSYILIFFSFIYSLFLTFYFPIDDSIIDRGNYLNYADNSEIIIQYYLNESILSVFFNEPIWLLINIFLSYFLSPEYTLRFIIFFSSFVVSFLVLKSNPKYFWILILILIFPSVIKNFIIHIRQGLAISFFLIGWFSVHKFKRYLFFLLVPFIHSSFFIVLAIYFLTHLFNKLKFAFDLKFIGYVSLGLVFSYGLIFVASLLNMRQVFVYEFAVINSSGLGFIFWFVILLIYISNGKHFLKNNSFIIGVIIFYLSTYFFIVVTARIFESVIILVLLAALELKYKFRIVAVTLFFFIIIYQFLLKMNMPYLGYGLI